MALYSNLMSSRSKQQKETHIQTNPLHSDLYDVIKASLRQKQRRDKEPVQIAKDSCSSCVAHPQCWTRQSPEDACIKNGIRYVLVILKIFGFLHKRSPNKKITKSFIYSCGFTALVWIIFFLFFRVYGEFYTFGSRLFYRIIIHLWYGQCALSYTVFLLQVSPRIMGFINKWNTFAYRHHCLTAQYTRKVCNKALMYGGIASVIGSLSLIIISFTFSSEHSPAHTYLRTVLGLKPRKSFLVLYMFHQAFYFVTWVLPTALFYTLVMGLRFNFLRITEMLQSATANTTGDHDLGSTIQILRGRHQTVCRLVKELDSILAIYLISVFATCIPVMCFCVYNFVFNVYDGSNFFVVMAICPFCVIMIQMTVVTGVATSLTTAANSPLEHLFDLQLRGEDIDVSNKAFQVSIFIHRITHCHIGFTAWNIFDVSKPMIFRVSTMVLSYVFVLFKLGLSLEKGSSPPANVTAGH